MEKEPDLEIVGKVKRGDRLAFTQLFETYYNSLCFFSNRYLNDLDLSRSIVQQVFVSFWINREKLSIQKSVKSYLFHSVRNASIDYGRRKKNQMQVVELNDEMIRTPFHDLIEEAELDEKINKAINDLPEKCREVFVACRLEGLKYAQIAEKLNISVRTVEMQMGIAIKKLRHLLTEYQMIDLLIFILSKK